MQFYQRQPKSVRIGFNTITRTALDGLHAVAKHRLTDAPAVFGWILDTSAQEARARAGRDKFPGYDIPRLSLPDLRFSRGAHLQKKGGTLSCRGATHALVVSFEDVCEDTAGMSRGRENEEKTSSNLGEMPTTETAARSIHAPVWLAVVVENRCSAVA